LKHFSKGIFVKYLSKIVKLSLTTTAFSLFFHFSHGCILFLCWHDYTFTPSIIDFRDPKATSIGESHTLFAMLCVVCHPQNIRAPSSHMCLSTCKLGTLQCCVVLPFCERTSGPFLTFQNLCGGYLQIRVWAEFFQILNLLVSITVFQIQ